MGLMSHMRGMTLMGFMRLCFHRDEFHPAFRAVSGAIHHYFGMHRASVELLGGLFLFLIFSA